MAIPEIEGIDYTTKEYLNFVQHIQSTVERLNAEVGGETPHWSPHRVELALWSHYVANDLSPELLDDMPPHGVVNNANINTNGSLTLSLSSKSKVIDNDDTNDGVAVDVDDESLGAGNIQIIHYILTRYLHLTSYIFNRYKVFVIFISIIIRLSVCV